MLESLDQAPQGQCRWVFWGTRTQAVAHGRKALEGPKLLPPAVTLSRLVLASLSLHRKWALQPHPVGSLQARGWIVERRESRSPFGCRPPPPLQKWGAPDSAQLKGGNLEKWQRGTNVGGAWTGPESGARLEDISRAEPMGVPWTGLGQTQDAGSQVQGLR